MILCHDDGPCADGNRHTPLKNGYCPVCKIHPDTQSTCFIKNPKGNHPFLAQLQDKATSRRRKYKERKVKTEIQVDIVDTLAKKDPVRAEAIRLVIGELIHQDNKFGAGRMLDIRDVYLILGEEVGEVATAVIEKQGQQAIIDELIDAAASALLGVESELRKRQAECK